MKKEPQGTYHEQGKEPVIERISALARKYPSRSAAARAWGINVNTLNSYFKNESSRPMPRENLLQRIADCEGVTLGWLQSGTGCAPESPKSPAPDGARDGLSEMLSFLTPAERQQLTAMLARKGVDTMIQLLFEFSSLTPSELERVIRLAQQIREGASEGNTENDLTDPTHRQVG